MTNGTQYRVWMQTDTGKRYLCDVSKRPQIWSSSKANAMLTNSAAEAKQIAEDWCAYFDVKGIQSRPEVEVASPTLEAGNKMEHALGSVGRYEITWNAANDFVTLWDTVKGVKVRTELCDLELTEAIELLENEQGEIGTISPEELMFILHYASTVETTREHASYDLQRFGEVGVSA